MTWTIVVVAFSLLMTLLAIAELRQPVTKNALRLFDRLFVVSTFMVAFIYGLTLLAAKIFL